MEKTSQMADIITPVEMSPEEFSAVGHKLVDHVANFLREIRSKPVTTAEQPKQIRLALGNEQLPVDGTPAQILLDEATELLFNHSLLNGHPSFWGYITSSATPIGALGDMLAASVNPNVGAYVLSPMATEIERQTVEWLAEFIGYNKSCGGLFVSGGNMANFVGFLAARKAKADWKIREEGINGFNGNTELIHPVKQLLVYCSKGTHTWIQKAADLFGLGTNAIRWIDMDEDQRLDTVKLKQQIISDLEKGYAPFLVIGTAGSVSTGAVDPLSEIAGICRQYDLWFHVDGAYGAPAAVLPENAGLFNGMKEADSIAIDPHKWLYSPLEAGCILVKNPQDLNNAFSFHPEYYNFDGNAEDPGINYYDYGLQNSRGFRALKVWLGIRQAGRRGYEEMIRNDIDLAAKLHRLVLDTNELEAVSNQLSITAFRYVPEDASDDEDYLNALNEGLLNQLQAGGKVFLSNAVVGNKYCLRVCIVNFRTRIEHLRELVEIVLAEGKELNKQMKNRSGI